MIHIYVLSDPKRKTCTWTKLFIHMQQRAFENGWVFLFILCDPTLCDPILPIITATLKYTFIVLMHRRYKHEPGSQTPGYCRSTEQEQKPCPGKFSDQILLHKRLQTVKTSEVNQWHLQTFEFSFPECLIRSWKRAVTYESSRRTKLDQYICRLYSAVQPSGSIP